MKQNMVLKLYICTSYDNTISNVFFLPFKGDFSRDNFHSVPSKVAERTLPKPLHLGFIAHNRGVPRGVH